MCQKAASGYDMFCRQDFVGIDYGLVDCATYTPLPDYYAGVIWGRTIGTEVLNVSATNSSTGGIRSYAHCSNGGGGVTLVVINLNKQDWDNATLTIAGRPAEDLDRDLDLAFPSVVAGTRWLLTGPEGTNSSLVSLNGENVLEMVHNRNASDVNASHTLSLPPLAGRNETFHVMNIVTETETETEAAHGPNGNGDGNRRGLVIPTIPAESVQFIVLHGLGDLLGCEPS